ncbi:hypothetical protein BN1708_002129 [Verticillium longisporum]|uniref:Calcineurin-like phosphoesterase domain-containing protein n=1 Tax=Verticillium longisporum TaxID=100787 RepID=A0A0G4KH84_VERLO|nr:hypothetical protein BN1708_002129 [Verticillium longisporum]
MSDRAPAGPSGFLPLHSETMPALVRVPSHDRKPIASSHGPIESARHGMGRLLLMAILTASDRSSTQLLIRKQHAGAVPADTDVLITHTPPFAHRDLRLGCPALLAELWRVRPRLHVFGHVHFGHGREAAHYDGAQAAYESLVARRGGPLRDLLPSGAWVDALKVAAYGLHAVVFKVLMLGPGGNTGGTWLVNAGLMKGNSGKLGNPPQVVVL